MPGGADRLRCFVGAPRRVDAGRRPPRLPAVRAVVGEARRARHHHLGARPHRPARPVQDSARPGPHHGAAAGRRARFRPVPPDRERFGLPESYVVCLGAVQPRKNLARLLEAWATVQARGDAGDAVLGDRRPAEAGGAAATRSWPTSSASPGPRALARLRRRRRPAGAAGRRALPRLPEPLRGLRPARGRGDGRRLPGDLLGHHLAAGDGARAPRCSSIRSRPPPSPTPSRACSPTRQSAHGCESSDWRGRRSCRGPGRPRCWRASYTDVMSATARR